MLLQPIFDPLVALDLKSLSTGASDYGWYSHRLATRIVVNKSISVVSPDIPFFRLHLLQALQTCSIGNVGC